MGVLAQTRRHAHIAALLGIPNVIACVNKMDLVAFDRERFDAIASELEAIAREACELAFALERELFDRGRIATVLTGTNGASPTAEAADACARGGLLALVPTPRTDQGHLCQETDQGRFAVEFGGERLEGADVEGLARRVAAALEVAPPKTPSH